MDKVTDYLVQSATKLAWSNPRGDYQYTFKPGLLSKPYGDIHTLRLPYVNIRLPSTSDRWVVYEMGQFGLWNIGVDDLFYGWKPLSEFIAPSNMLIEVFVNNRLLDLSSIYFQRNENQNNLLAIKYTVNKELLDLREDLYIRFYSNAWFGTTDGQASAGMQWSGRQIAVPQDAADMVNAISAITNQKQLLTYHNGYLIEKLLVGEQQVGDNTQYYHDSSIIDYFDVPFTTLDSYQSDRDRRRKVIISIPDSIVLNIACVDDIEVYVCDVENNLAGVERTVGVRYSRIDEYNMRQLTQRDYALDALRIEQIISEHKERLDRTTSFIRVYIRHATKMANLPEDGQLLRELYLLPLDLRRKLMIGGVSVIPEWQAKTLEVSPYMKWLQGDGDYINAGNIKNVYSYHALTRVSDMAVKNGTSNFTLPPSMLNGGLVISCDADGLMHDMAEVPANTIAYAAPPNTESIECIPGRRATIAATIENVSSLIQDPVASHFESRWYRFSGQEWKLAKEGTDYTLSQDGTTATWNASFVSAERVRRLGDVYYKREFVIAEENLGKAIAIFEGSPPFVDKPMARLDIWINGRRLVENVDFLVDHPRVWITSRDYYLPNTPINVTLVYHGAPGEIDYKPTYGSIKHRYINYGKPFSLAVHRPRITIINGMVALEDETDFSESRKGTLDARFRDGHMYGLLPVINHMPLKAVESLSTSAKVALDKDKQLEVYLSDEIDEPELPGPILIPGKHGVISALFTKLIEDLDAERLDVSFGPTSSAAIAAILSEYKTEMEADLYLREKFDLDFFEIHPNGRNTTTIVNGVEFNFLNKINQDMFGGSVNLVNYISIS